MRLEFTIDGKKISFDTDSGRLLSEIIEMVYGPDETVGIFDAASGCREGECGRCMVIVDGAVCHSCLIPGFRIRGKQITTFPGFKKTKDYEYIKTGFTEAGYDPCRLCAAGRVLVTHSLIQRFTLPTREQILEGFSAVRCHCSGYEPFHSAVKNAARIRRLHE